jgi:hypothetical protein
MECDMYDCLYEMARIEMAKNAGVNEVKFFAVLDVKVPHLEKKIFECGLTFSKKRCLTSNKTNSFYDYRVFLTDCSGSKKRCLTSNKTNSFYDYRVFLTDCSGN